MQIETADPGAAHQLLVSVAQLRSDEDAGVWVPKMNWTITNTKAALSYQARPSYHSAFAYLFRCAALTIRHTYIHPSTDIRSSVRSSIPIHSFNPSFIGMQLSVLAGGEVAEWNLRKGSCRPSHPSAAASDVMRPYPGLRSVNSIGQYSSKA